MDVSNTPYWIFEFIKVIIGYLLLEFAWPRFVFGRHLSGKPVVYQFAFCVTVQTVLINTVVLGLGLLHILNRWTVRAVFYGALLVVLYQRLGVTEERTAQFLQALSVARVKLLFKRLRRLTADWVQGILRSMRAHTLEYLMLGAIAVYALIYFSWGAFQTNSYGFGDQYTHHSWIYGLQQGQIFSGGVYPEALHCLIYAINTLLGVRVYSLMLFFGSVQGVVFLIAVYCLCRELFGWRYTPVFLLAMFILVMAGGNITLTGMGRLQYTLPLEFGLTPQFLCITYFARYLRGDHKPSGKGRFANYILGTDLFLFTMALAAMIASHFYPVIMAFFMCLGVGLHYLRRVFSKERFLPLMASVLCGVLIAVIPMLGALASGIEFQASMDWAMSVIDGTDNESRGEDLEAEVLRLQLQEEQLPLTKRIILMARLAGHLFRRGFEEMSDEQRGNFLLMVIPIVFAACLLVRLVVHCRGASIINWSKKRGVNPYWLDGYCLMVLITVFLIAVYVAPYFGLPELISGVRMASTVRAMLFAVALIPLDFVLILLAGWIKTAGLKAVSTACLVLLCAWSCIRENYHGYLYYELTRYRAEVAVMNDIIDKYSRYIYTVVSPTDGLYHVIEHGRHEELLDFVRETAGERYFLPTEYVFVFVEKRPIEYAQTHFFTGPEWLALEKHTRGGSSQAPNIWASEISRTAAEEDIPSLTPPFQNYKNLESRTILESKAYYWCQQFMKLYPHEMSVYYEDDDFICYYFRQEANSPYDLTIAYEED